MRFPARWRVIGIAGLAAAVLTAAVQMRNVQRPVIALVDEAATYRLPAAIHGPIHMTVLGDSLGFGSGASSPQLGFTNQIFEQLRLLRSGSSFANFAMPHATTREVIERQLPNLSAESNVVLLVTGSNDVQHYGRVGRFARDYAELISSIRCRNPSAVIIAAGLLDISLAPAVPHLAKPAVAAFSAMSNAEIERIAALNGVLVIDFFGFSHAVRERLAEVMSGDGWHPGDTGHSLMAQHALATFTTLL
jgi:lysophospholipase L1-like esterase